MLGDLENMGIPIGILTIPAVTAEIIRSSGRHIEFSLPVTAFFNASLVDMTNEFRHLENMGVNRNFDDNCCTRRDMFTSGLATAILDFSIPVTSDSNSIHSLR